MAGRRRALLVAVDEYEDEKLPALAAPVRDAWALAEVLGDESVGGFEVEIIQDEVTSTIFERLEELLGDCGKDDVVLLHFACHGLKDDDGSLYLTGRNTRHRRLISTAIDTAAVTRMMRRSRAGSVILLLDCCYGGAFAKGVLARAGDDLDLGVQIDRTLGGGRGLAVITAASTTEWAFEVDGSGRRGAPHTSVFTRALVDGIRTGEADHDQDGRIALGELFGYVYDRVRAERPGQTPGKWEFNLRGDLYLARTPRRRVTPAELPAPVRELVASPYPEWRVGGVHELAELAAGKDLPLALAARTTLRALSDDDSRKVSLAAADALARTEIRLSHTSVDLGLVRARSLTAPAATAREVTLLGVPLAVASTVTADPGLRAVIDDDRLVITVAPSVTGLVEGTVTLSGPAGEASVRVTGWVAPDPRPFVHDAARLAGTMVGNAAGEAVVLTVAGLVAARIGDRPLAARLLDRTPELLRVTSDRAERAALTALRAWVLDQVGDRPGSRTWLDRARAYVPAWDEKDVDAGVAALLVEWAEVLTGGGLPGLDGMVFTATRLVRAERDPLFRALGLAGIAWATASAGRTERAASLLDEVVSGVAAESVASARARALLAIAWAWTRTGSAEQALELLAAAEEAARTEEDAANRGIALTAAAWLAAHAGAPERSSALLTEAQSVAEGMSLDEDYEDRSLVLLVVAWVAAHTGATERAVRILDAYAAGPPAADATFHTVGTAASAWIALIAGDFERYGRWLDEAKTAGAALTGPAEAAVAALVVAWVRAQGGGTDAVSPLVEAARTLIDLLEREDELGAWTLIRTALALLGLWIGDRDQAVELLAQAEETIVRVRAANGDADSQALWLSVAAAYVATQADDRERAVRLTTQAGAYAGQVSSVLEAAIALLALAWIGHAGERPPFRLLLDLVGVLVPTEYRTDRTEILLGVWTTFCRRLLAPG